MAGLNFNDVATKKVAEVERPPLPPVGEYRFAITKLPVVTTTKDEAWDIVEFQARALEAITADMADYKGEVNGIVQRLAFMFDKNDQVSFDRTMFRLRGFLENHLGVATPDMSMKEALNASVNAQFMGTIQHVVDKQDKELFHANITQTAPLE